MIRTQVSLTEDQMERARRAAADRGISLAALVRQALDRMLDDSVDEKRRARALLAIGGFHSGHRDTSDRHDDVLAEQPRW